MSYQDQNSSVGLPQWSETCKNLCGCVSARSAESGPTPKVGTGARMYVSTSFSTGVSAREKYCKDFPRE